MGFEQLAALKAQLTKEAKLKKQQEQTAEKPAPAAKQGLKQGPKQGVRPSTKPAGKGDRPARPASPPRASEKTPPVDPVVRVIGKLQKRFPAAFPKNPAPKVPLKVGILADLIAQASDLQLTEAEIREAVSTWCRGSRYWACLTDGAARVDLSGAPAGTVTARDAAFARNQAKGGPGGRRKPQGKPNAGQANAGQANAVQANAASADQASVDRNDAAQANAEAAHVADEKSAEPAGAEVSSQPQHGDAPSDASPD
jgi:ProP effector